MQTLRSIFSSSGTVASRAVARAVAALGLALGLGLTLALGSCIAEPDLGAWKQCTDGTFCPADTTCSADGATCLRCGDGIRSSDEECDDENLDDGDGCDSNCTRTGCGNGVVTTGESCDDGNLNDGDSCDRTCASHVCGDCIISLGEECDDGNLNDGDGCEGDCRRTPGLPLTSPGFAGPGCPKGPGR